MEAQPSSQEQIQRTVEVASEGQLSLRFTATPELIELLDSAALINSNTSERFDLSFSALMIAFYFGKQTISGWYRKFIVDHQVDFQAILTYRQLNEKDLQKRFREAESPFSKRQSTHQNGQTTATVSAHRWLGIASDFARQQDHAWVGLRHMILAVIFTSDFHADDLQRWKFDRRTWGLSYLAFVAHDLPGDLQFCRRVYERTFGPIPPDPVSDRKRQSGDAANSDALLPFLPDAYQLSWAPRNILAVVSTKAAQTNESMSTSHVLFELADQGKPGRVPLWAGDFLRSILAAQGGTFDRTIAGYRARAQQTTSAPSDAVLASTEMTQGLAWVLGQASEIATQTSGSDDMRGRHLLAALILDPPQPYTLGSLKRLQEMGMDLPLFRERFYDWVRGYGDDDRKWRALLVTATTDTYRKVQFDADSTIGPNLLSIEQDVLAMATLVAARDSVPPLSIGLFGEWGSGKTFFMGQLRTTISKLAKDAEASRKMQRDLPFYKRIVQIEFNAWHYVEGNLWASMVEHILDNLRVFDDQQPALTLKLQKHWIEKLGFAERAKTEADRKQEAAEQRVSAAEQDVQDKKKDLEDKQQELQTLSSKSVEKAFELSGAVTVIRQALQPLGIDPLSAAAVDLQSSLREARSVLQSGASTLMPLLRAEDREARWTWLLIILLGAPVAAVLIGLLMSTLRPQIAQISGFATGAAGLLTGIAAWLRKQAEWTTRQIKKVERAQGAYEKELAAQLAATVAAKQKAEDELTTARQEYSLAQQKAEQARRDQDAAKGDLAAATTAHLLGQFIQDRAASTDYRKHLGVLAVVRQDFQELSRLIEEDNWRLSPDRADDPKFKGLTKIQDLEEEKKDDTTRINRIVLYIDDLDRCPPAKVVEVLQAVHLLLAFPLFVVVVGVDARWISQSLDARYRELLHVGSTDAAMDLKQTFGYATSQDYLEKIFQIPLWLRTMDANAARRMIQGMLRPASGGSGMFESRRSGGPEGNAGTATTITSSIDARIETRRSTSLLTADLGTKPDIPTDEKPTKTTVEQRIPEPPPVPVAPNLESLKIEDFELKMIDDLSSLLGRSPRALKRFVNLYRFMKARLSSAEHRAFVTSTADTIADYEAVLFLLAVETGLPRTSLMLSEELARLAREPAPPNITIAELIAKLDKGSAAQTRDWRTLRNWLAARQNSARLNQGIPRLASWVEQVSRYSFQHAPPELTEDTVFAQSTV